MRLRPYQQAAVNAVFNEWYQEKHDRTLAILPTGCGKTILFSEITKREVREKQHKVLILAHREELLLQAQDKLFRTTGLYAELEKGKSSTVDSETPVVIGSIQTLCRARRLNQFTPDTFDCIIIDEAHHCLSESYQRVLWYFKNAHVLGVTATPDRGDKKELAEYFNSTAYQYNLLDAIKDGYLTPINLLKLDVSIDLSNVHIKNGDYDENDLGDSIRPYLYDIASKLKANCFGRKIAVFLPLISISQEFTAIMNEVGFNAVEVNGSSQDRQEKLQAFERGEYNVICNALLLVEGWDCPAVDCIVVLRPTKIRSLYCLDENTEILTKDGWVKDAQIGDMVAAYNKNTGEIVYTPVIEKVRRPLEQDEYFCSIKSPTLDIRVTNKHRMLYDNKKRLGWKFTTAERLSSLKSGVYLPVSGNLKTKGIPLTDDEIKFLTWFMTDGSLNKSNGVIQISQGEHQPWLEEIAACINACNLKYGRRSSWRKTSFNQTSKNVVFYISYGQPRGTDKDKRGWAYLEKYLDKDIPDSFFEMNDRQFDIMLHIAHLADGHKNMYTMVKGNSYHISKGNKRFIERLQILAITHGYKANVAVSYQNQTPLYTLHVKKKTYAVCGSTYDKRPTWIKEPHTTENCWCVQNVYGTLITRRNGKVSIVGNCQMVGRGLRLSPETGKKDCQLVDFMWLSERHDLCNATSLVCETDEQSRILQEMMSETAEIDLMTAAQEANKKLLEEEDEEPKEKGSTEDTIRQNLIKNLNILNVEQNSMLSIVNHEDIYKWEQEPASEKQIQMLEKNGFKLTNVSRGMASKIISIIVDRTKNGLATFKQVKLLKSHGLKNSEKWSMDEASRCISYLAAHNWYLNSDQVEKINEVMMRKYA